MVKINNRDFKIYDLDSEKTINERIAVDMKTLPNFLIFPNGIPSIEMFSKDQNIDVIDLLDIIKRGSNIVDVYDKLKEYEDVTIGNISMTEFIKIYTVLNENFTQVHNTVELIEEEYKGGTILSELSILQGQIKSLLEKHNITLYITYKDLETFWNTKQKNQKALTKEIEENKKEWDINVPNNKLAVFNKFDNIEIPDPLPYSAFKLEKITFEFELEIKNTSSILEIFNSIVLNTDIPFASTNNFYKILNGFTPPIEWANLFDRSTTFRDKYKDIDRQNNIVLKILEEKKVKNKDRYTDIIISMKNINTIKIRIEYNEKLISKKKIITNCLSIFKSSNTPQNINEVSVNGTFYLYFQSLNIEGMLDIITNHPIFSALINVNEGSISKLPSIYIYFENSRIGKVNANLTSVLVNDKNIKILASINKEYFPLNSYCLRVRITKCDDLKKVVEFQNLFYKLLTIYNKELPGVLEFYEDHGCPIEDEPENIEIVEDEDTDELKNIDPFVFSKESGYSTSCQKPVKPRYLSDEEARKEIAAGNQDHIIRFPKEIIEGKSTPKYYICENGKYIYPGLKENKFKDTKKLLPYIPCCFQKIQTDKEKYKDYYFTEKEGTSVASSKAQKTLHIISNLKTPLKRHSYGLLPSNLKKLFLIGDQEGTYYREGLLDSKSSFLDCVLRALNIGNAYDKSDDTLTRLLYRTRNSLATEENANYCKQEMFEYTVNEIQNKIKNFEVYLDPKLFIHLLELHFECNIFLFSAKNDGEFIVPNNIECYYKMKNKNKCIFIFENLDIENKNLLYPRCELIVKYDKNDEIKKGVFEFNEGISKIIFKTFYAYIRAYALNTPVSLVDINWPWQKLKVISQVFDSYGKTRILNINHNRKTISIFTSPIQPLNLESKETLDTIFKTDLKTAREVLTLIDTVKIRETYSLNSKKIGGMINNVEVYILIEDDNLQVTNISTKSAMSDYNKYRKLTRYIIEYMFWLFSIYLSDNNITTVEDIDANVYERFKNKYIKLDKDFEYKNVEKLFKLQNSGIIEDGKLVVKSDESLKRLFYVLRMKLLRDRDNIFTYKDKTLIENYYLDITDFTHENNQYILQSEKAFFRLFVETNRNIIYKKIHVTEEKKEVEDEDDEDDEEQSIISEDDLENKKPEAIETHNDVSIYKTTPYFFKNNIIDSKNIYIAQNVNSYLKGIKISKIWNNEHYNPGSDVKIYETDILDENFTLYSFTNINDIKKYNVEGNLNDLNIKILGTKIEDPNTNALVNLFTVLLPL